MQGFATQPPPAVQISFGSHTVESGTLVQRSSPTSQASTVHAVPSVLARNKDLVAVYEKHWNRYVSPGEAIYAHHGPGKDLLAEARRQGLSSKARVHEKEIFL